VLHVVDQDPVWIGTQDRLSRGLPSVGIPDQLELATLVKCETNSLHYE